MSNRVCAIVVLIGGLFPFVAVSQDTQEISKKYKGLKCPLPRSAGTWSILDRDGANRPVEPYLSSLGGGETGTGVIVSPSFTLSVEKIAFTICGHDGQGGGRGTNFVSLVDVGTRKTLRKTPAPGSDPMQERAWDVAELQGHKVRVEVHDGNTDGAYAWLGIGRIDAGPPLTIDFRKGLPEDWKSEIRQPADDRTELVAGGVPFLCRPALYTLVPKTGVLEIPCGFRAERLFFLGCTVASGAPLVVYGYIEIVYRGGFTERYPLMFGYTLDGEAKLPSDSKAMHIHASGDQFQFYLVLAPGDDVIEMIRLERNPSQPWLPRITAISCETRAESENLVPLPDGKPSAEEEAWMQSHAISPRSPNLSEIAAEILRAH